MAESNKQRILLVAPHRVGNTSIYYSITDKELLSYISLEGPTRALEVSNNYSVETLKKVVEEHADNNSILRIHPEWIFTEYTLTNRNTPGIFEFFNKLIDTYQPTHILTVLRKNVYDQALSLTSVNKRIRAGAPDKPDPWHVHYKDTYSSPDKWEVTQSLYESFICSELSARHNFPIFWYEDIYTGEPADLYPLLDHLDLNRNLVLNPKFFKYYSKKSKLKQS